MYALPGRRRASEDAKHIIKIKSDILKITKATLN